MGQADQHQQNPLPQSQAGNNPQLQVQKNNFMNQVEDLVNYQDQAHTNQSLPIKKGASNSSGQGWPDD